MRRNIVSQTGAGSTAWVPVDYAQNQFKIGFGVVASGTVDYTVEHTFDDVFDSSVTPTAFSHADVAAQTASADGNYAFPIAAIRVTVNSGTGSATLTILQGRK